MKRLAHDSKEIRGVRLPARSAQREDGQPKHREAPGQGRALVSDIPPTVNTGERRQADAHLNEAPYVFHKIENARAAQPNQELITSYQAPASAPIQLCMRDGKIVMQMVRIPAQSECCAIDTVRVTMHEKTIFNKSFRAIISDEDVARGFSECIEQIFGFGISKKYDKGRDFFLHAWELGDNYGHFAMGGIKQRDSILIAINGQGCLAAKAGWELRLYQFLTSSDCIAPRITRVDLAHDDFDGSQLSVYDFDRAWEDGGFDRYGNRPEPQNYGSWKTMTLWAKDSRSMPEQKAAANYFVAIKRENNSALLIVLGCVRKCSLVTTIRSFHSKF